MKETYKKVFLLLLAFLLLFGEMPLPAQASGSDSVIGEGTQTVSAQAPSIKTIQNHKDGVRVRWNPVVGVATYGLYRKVDGVWSLYQRKLTGTEFIDQKVKSGKVYRYAVCCMSQTGEQISKMSNPSDPLRYMKTPGIKSAVSDPKGFSLRWQKVSGAGSYRIYRKTAKGWKLLKQTSKTSYLDRSARVGKTYTYTVRSVSKDKKTRSATDSIGLKAKYKNPIVRILIVDKSAYGNEGLKRELERQGAVVTVTTTANVDVKKYDGLVLPGGGDIDPARYGEKVNGADTEGSNGIDPKLDKLQFAVMKKFVKAKKPVLGICRGCQFINVYFGGTLHQNLGHSGMHWGEYHNVSIEKDSMLGKLYGKKLRVYSSHHQAAKKLGKKLIATAWARDGIIEAIEHTELPVYGVQFHPEVSGMDGGPIFKRFVQICREHK